MSDLSYGGIFAALYNMSEYGNVGFRVNLRDIRVNQCAIEICEMFNVNPYELESMGALLFTTDAPDEMLAMLNDNGVECALIGTVNAGCRKEIVNLDELRSLEMPGVDEVYRFL